MKKILMLLLAAALLAGCNSGTEKKENTEQEAIAAEWVEVTLNVEGMTCDGCEDRKSVV